MLKLVCQYTLIQINEIVFSVCNIKVTLTQKRRFLIRLCLLPQNSIICKPIITVNYICNRKFCKDLIKDARDTV